jgi:hypothetical protein
MLGVGFARIYVNEFVRSAAAFRNQFFQERRKTISAPGLQNQFLAWCIGKRSVVSRILRSLTFQMSKHFAKCKTCPFGGSSKFNDNS